MDDASYNFGAKSLIPLCNKCQSSVQTMLSGPTNMCSPVNMWA